MLFTINLGMIFLIVSFEGPNGSGKDTLINYLESNYNLKTSFKFPSYKMDKRNIYSNMIKNILLKKQNSKTYNFVLQYLTYLDKLYFKKEIENIKNEKDVYMFDRYVSTCLYLLTSFKKDSRSYKHICNQYNKNIVKPDIEFILISDDPDHTLYERVCNCTSDKDMFETKEKIKFINDFYKEELTEPSLTHNKLGIIIDNKTVEELAEEVITHITNYKITQMKMKDGIL